MIENGRIALVDLGYFAAAICFIYGLKQLSSPATARRGNQLAAIGMLVAVVVTFFHGKVEDRADSLDNIILIVVGLALGTAIGAVPSRAVKMTDMPQMVAIFNGMGGITAALVSVAEFSHQDGIGRGEVSSIVLGTIIGSVSFTGSVIAFLKLQELMSGRPILLPNRQIVNGALFAAIVLLGLVVIGIGGQDGSAAARGLLVVVFLAALVLGALLVVPIGGADMPVVIALLNSATGLAAALTGFVLNNQALVVAGALVGASGTLLTLLMARAMNRKVTNVLFGAFGSAPAGGAGAAGGGEARPIRETTADDAAVNLAFANRVIIVPGYGLAVARAQREVKNLADLLQDRGVEVKYAIHPVAGRMPGHMNVLLAEAEVSYDDLFEMEEINEEFRETDVALVIGANDVTNPAARTDNSSPIFGMPILNVDQAQNIIVLKRSMKSGFAGIENELFHDPKTTMLFGDAKESLDRLISAVKAA